MKHLLKIELNPKRIYGLDVLRALAILFVVIGHGRNLMTPEIYKYVKVFVFDGVSIFFVLSGFLIGGILIKILEEQKLTANTIFNFWIRRWFRTLPNYFFILALLLLLNILFTANFIFFDKIKYFFFSQNIYYEHPTFFPEAWSLSIEEWFYLLIPVIMFVILKYLKFSVKSTIIITAVGIILLVTLFRYYRFENYEIDTLTSWDRVFRKQVVTRLDSLMYGIIGAYVFYYSNTLWYKYKKLCLFLGILLFIIIKFNLLNFERFGLYHCVFSFSIVSIATLLITPFLSSIKSGKGFFYKAITYISLISYSMYLLNLRVVQGWILKSVDWTILQNLSTNLYFITRYLLYWVLTIVISILLYKYFEVPTMNLRDRFRKKV